MYYENFETNGIYYCKVWNRARTNAVISQFKTVKAREQFVNAYEIEPLTEGSKNL